MYKVAHIVLGNAQNLIEKCESFIIKDCSKMNFTTTKNQEQLFLEL